MADDLELSFSGYPFEHVRPLASGAIGIDGATITFSPGRIGDLNTHVFSGPRELGFTEIGLGPYLLAYINEGFRAYALIPVFPLRTFRHKSIFVHADAGIDDPSQLAGKRIGTPGYSSSSLTWIRGMLSDEYGVRAEDVEWVLSASDSSAALGGAQSAQERVIPEGLDFSVGPDGMDESDLLVERHVDALFHAIEPRAYVEGHPKVRRLFEDTRQAERAYFAKTGIFPIMHAVAVRQDLVDENPSLPAAIFAGYARAKAEAYAEMKKNWAFRTLPWFAQEWESTVDLMGDNFLPYGVETNRKALEAFIRYLEEQRLTDRRIALEDLFVPSTLELVDG